MPIFSIIKDFKMTNKLLIKNYKEEKFVTVLFWIFCGRAIFALSF